MQVYCDKDLRHNNITIPNGENLLRYKDLLQVRIYMDDGYFSSGNLLIKTDSLQNGPHTFYFKGKTSIGNNISDILVLYYR